MRYLKKRPDSRIVSSGWNYDVKSQRTKIREELLREQCGFCAYSERFVGQIDACDIEHFDPRNKHTDLDGYRNWYAVLSWMNSHKPKNIEPYLPILPPDSPDLAQRIVYEDGEFVPIREDDIEARNLIEYLGWNRCEVSEARRNHVGLIRDLRKLTSEGEPNFLDCLRRHPEQLSFATALEAELGIPVGELLADGVDRLPNLPITRHSTIFAG